MTGIYLTDLAAWLRAAGLEVVEYAGWQTRARSSGGFPSTPLGVQWHHTASDTSPANDAAWMWNNSDDRPIGNVLLARDGVVWIGAAGAANTAGKGGPLTLSRGTVPVDQANTRTFAVEAANNGVGQAWPQAQIDAYFVLSNTLNARFGNEPGDVFNHQTWAPTRKIDPATAAAVQGPWRPGSSTSSGTWEQQDVAAECRRRATPTPTPEEEPMYIWRHTRYADAFAVGAGALHINQTVAKKLRAQGVEDIVEADDRMLDWVCQASGFPKSSLAPV